MSNKQDKKLHIAMYPWFAFGHLTTFLDLANKLAERGHKISFFLPSKTRLRLASNNHHPDLITFIPITVPPVDGLPPGAETTNDVPAADRPKIMEAMDMTKDVIDSHLEHLKPDFIFFDFTHWLPELARKHRIKSMYYVTSYMVMSAYCSAKARNLPHGHRYSEVDLLSAPPGFPCPDIRLRAHEARFLVNVINLEFGGGMSLTARHAICVKDTDIIAFKSCMEMEGVYYKFIEDKWGKPVLLTGPALPRPPTSQLEEKFDSWLNGFNEGAVVYCALGSECVLDKNQFQELVLGLELSGRPFLAALRPPNGCETVEAGLPEGFLERIKGRGIVHGGWVQQQLILNHPSVGCFVTHSGPGSLTEALASDCQLVMLPQSVDQFVVAKMMSMDLKVGIEVEKGEDDGFSTKEAVSKAVTIVMDPESKVGREVRANRAHLKEALRRPGLEDSYIDGLVQSLQNMYG